VTFVAGDWQARLRSARWFAHEFLTNGVVTVVPKHGAATALELENALPVFATAATMVIAGIVVIKKQKKDILPIKESGPTSIFRRHDCRDDLDRCPSMTPYLLSSF